MSHFLLNLNEVRNKTGERCHNHGKTGVPLLSLSKLALQPPWATPQHALPHAAMTSWDVRPSRPKAGCKSGFSQVSH